MSKTADERKEIPLHSGLLAYFPLALQEVAKVSKAGNDKHNPGEPLHWAQEKSQDHLDCGSRHLLDHARGEKIDPEDNCWHLAKAIWRFSAWLNWELEAKALGIPVEQHVKNIKVGAVVAPTGESGYGPFI